VGFVRHRSEVRNLEEAHNRAEVRSPVVVCNPGAAHIQQVARIQAEESLQVAERIPEEALPSLPEEAAERVEARSLLEACLALRLAAEAVWVAFGQTRPS